MGDDERITETQARNAITVEVDIDRLRRMERHDLLEQVKADLVQWAKARIWIVSLLTLLGVGGLAVQQLQNFLATAFADEINKTREATAETRAATRITNEVLTGARKKLEELEIALTKAEERAGRLEGKSQALEVKHTLLADEIEELQQEARQRGELFRVAQSRDTSPHPVQPASCTNLPLLIWLSSTAIDRAKVSGCGRALTNEDRRAIAQKYQLEPAVLKAVDAVEGMPEGGFLKDGRPPILFEATVFNRLTAGRYSASNPTISTPKWTSQYYTKGATREIRSSGEYDRLSQAAALDMEAALQSASWGRHQLMGFNYKVLGFESAESLVRSLTISEKNQLEVFVKYIVWRDLLSILKEKRWADFARKYNGPEYKKNRYDSKLAEAYDRFKEEDGEN